MVSGSWAVDGSGSMMSEIDPAGAIRVIGQSLSSVSLLQGDDTCVKPGIASVSHLEVWGRIEGTKAWVLQPFLASMFTFMKFG